MPPSSSMKVTESISGGIRIQSRKTGLLTSFTIAVVRNQPPHRTVLEAACDRLLAVQHQHPHQRHVPTPTPTAPTTFLDRPRSDLTRGRPTGSTLSQPTPPTLPTSPTESASHYLGSRYVSHRIPQPPLMTDSSSRTSTLCRPNPFLVQQHKYSTSRSKPPPGTSSKSMTLHL